MKIILFLIFLLPSLSFAAVEIVAPHSPGGPSDMISRSIHHYLSKDDYTVIYKPGAGTLTGIRHTINNDAILISTFIQTFVTNPKVYPNLSYDPYNDLEIIATVAVMPSVLVCNKKTGFNSYEDFKSTNKKLNFGIAGYGSTEHIATEILFIQINKIHNLIPYSKGGSNAVKDLIGGHIDCIFSNYPTIKKHVSNESLVFLISTHDIDNRIVSWESKFNVKFPIQSLIGLVVSTRLDENLKKSILTDLQNELHKSSDKLKDLGFFPNIGLDNDSINHAIKNNNEIKKIIEERNIKLKN